MVECNWESIDKGNEVDFQNGGLTPAMFPCGQHLGTATKTKCHSPSGHLPCCERLVFLDAIGLELLDESLEGERPEIGRWK